jgi:hypothetical protein
MAVYAKLVKGMNASRPFKTIDTVENRVSVRPADNQGSATLLSDVVRTTVTANPAADPTADVGVDNITLNMAMRCLATVQSAAGDPEKATATARAMLEHFTTPGIPEFVRAGIQRQVAPFLQAEEDGKAAAVEDGPSPRAKARTRARRG